MKINEEISRLYREATNGCGLSCGESEEFAQAFRDTLAELLKREFEATNHCITAEKKGDGVTAYRTNFDDVDPRHDWQFADWQAEAHRILTGER